VRGKPGSTNPDTGNALWGMPCRVAAMSASRPDAFLTVQVTCAPSRRERRRKPKHDRGWTTVDRIDDESTTCRIRMFIFSSGGHLSSIAPAKSPGVLALESSKPRVRARVCPCSATWAGWARFSNRSREFGGCADGNTRRSRLSRFARQFALGIADQEDGTAYASTSRICWDDESLEFRLVEKPVQVRPPTD